MCTNLPPMTTEAMAPMTDMIAAAMNTITSPEWKGSEISCGKKVFPVRAPLSAAESVSSAPVGPRIVATGL